MSTQNIKKIVLAYSGGLDTSAIIPWLKENYGDCEVVAFVANIGQDPADLEGVEKKALQSGASECHVADLREEFISEYVYPVLQTGALYEGTYLLGTSMARPIIAKAQVELALKVGADALCHGATGKGNDQVRFETTYTALAPQLKVVAPWREWDLRSREALLDYLKERNIPTTASLEKSTAVMRTHGTSLQKAACWKAQPTHRTKIAGCGPLIHWKRQISQKT
ncbi:argininosuccinate synthase domain-containing protein [Pantoea rodasii]|uniref:argininosuccinate synthase domain-containing protein n=1 Tax=Pantoea rodasii TaxID=1076549 RepID=UPI003453F0D0